MKKEKPQSRETLLYILYSYKKLIENGKDFPAALISDLNASINYVLNRNDYNETNYIKYKEDQRK